MLHPSKVAHAIFWSTFRRVRELSGIKPRPKQPPAASAADLARRYGLLCSWLQDAIPEHVWPTVRGTTVCEVGPGDCLTTAALLLGRGASHVDLIEQSPPVLSRKHVEVLELLTRDNLPLDQQILQTHDTVEVNPAKATFQTFFMEDFAAEAKYSLVYSLNVLEHVEQVEGFFRSCHRATKPGGWNVHIIDLGGHGGFEEPVPPLDFQTYPDWLYGLMFPTYHRATRRFVSDYRAAAEQAGFQVNEARPIRKADPEYVKRIWPKLRAAARRQPVEEIPTLEFALIAKKL